MSKSQSTRIAILGGAVKVASVLGLESVSLAELANSVGMSKSGLFAHFGSLESLRVETIREAASQFTTEVAIPISKTPPGKAQLISFLDCWMSWATSPERPGGCPLIGAIFPFDNPKTEVTEAIAEEMERLLKFITKLVAQAHSADLNPSQSPEITANGIFGIYLAFHVNHWLFKQENATETSRMNLKKLLS